MSVSPAILKFKNTNYTETADKRFINVIVINSDTIGGVLQNNKYYMPNTVSVVFDNYGNFNLSIKSTSVSSGLDVGSANPAIIDKSDLKKIPAIFSFKNPLTSAEISLSEEPIAGNIAPPTFLSSLKTTFIHSKNVQWIIYKPASDGVSPFNIYLLYNFFHRPEFKTFYSTNKADGSTLYRQYVGLVGSEPFATCEDNEACMKNVLGSAYEFVKNSNDAGYGTTMQQCPCFNKNCQAYKNVLASSNSFIYDLKTLECTSTNVISICNSTINADDFKVGGGVNIEQKCNASHGTQDPTPTPSPNDPTPTSPPNDPTPTSPPNKPSTTPPPTPLSKKYSNSTIIMIVSLLIVIIAIFLFLIIN